MRRSRASASQPGRRDDRVQVRIAHTPAQLERQPRAVAVGSFDGVHRGHQAVVRAAVETGLATTVITFDPHPRIALGNQVELITSLERRIELLANAGADATLVAAFTPELMRLEPEEFARSYLRAIGAEAVIAGEDFRFGARRRGDLELLEHLGFTAVVVSEVEGVSSTAIRRALAEGTVEDAAQMLGRPYELDGVVVAGDQRGGTLGYPTANLALEPQLACPRFGIYAGSALGHQAAVSVGTNPHYGGTERRIEPYLLDFDGDLYGKRLLVELWQRLRDEAVFASEEDLVAQIARDVEATRAARRPV
jgi:riboflavin kinase / FMN adenylyltransferase